MHSKEPLKEVTGLGGRRRHGPSHRSAGSPSHLSLRVGFRFYIGRCIGACHLSSGILRIAGVFVVVASEIAPRVVISHCFDQLERIGMMCGGEPGNLHIELAFILRERAFENARSDRARDLAAVPRGALHHHYDDVFRMVKWRETSKPRNVFLVAPVSRLRGAGFPRDHPIFQTRSATGAAVFINNLPKAFANELDLIRRDFLP